jgi:hypothetical protein
MNQHCFVSGGQRYKRITKTAARKRWCAGLPVTLCPCNLRPGLPYWPHILVQKPVSTDGKVNGIYLETDFDKVINGFMYHNCQSTETGRYASYYEVTNQ